MPAPSISVVIPVKDDARISRCVASVLREAVALPGPSVEVLVVDNGSAPAFRQSLDALAGGSVRVVDEPQPGAYAARNRAIRESGGQILFFTDADAEVQPGWFTAGIAALGCGAHVVQGISDDIFSSRAMRALLTPSISTEAKAVRVDTRNVAVARQVFDTLEFDARYFRGQDIAFGRLAAVRGFRIVREPGMRVLHYDESDLRLYLAKVAAWSWNGTRFRRQHRTITLARRPATARLRRWVRWAPLSTPALAQGALAIALLGSLLLERSGPLTQTSGARFVFEQCVRCAGLAGHLMHEAGLEEPSPAALARKSGWFRRR